MMQRIAALLCLSVLSVIFASGQPFKEHHSESYEVNDQWTLVLKNDAGNVAIVGWNQPRVQVDWTICSSSKQGLDVPWVEIRTDHQEVNVRTARPISKTRVENSQVVSAGPWRVDYIVHVPRRLRTLDLSTMDGEVSIVGAQGDVKLSALTGKVTIEDAAGNLEVSTLHTKQTVRLAAVSGHRSIQLRSVNGSILISMSAKSDVNVVASSANGGFSNEFGWVPQARKYEDGKDLQGKLGTGDATLNIEDVNGSVTIAAERGMR